MSNASSNSVYRGKRRCPYNALVSANAMVVSAGLCIFLFLAPILAPNTAYAAVNMEVGNQQGMRLDDRGMSPFETEERRGGQNGVVMRTPPRPAADSTQVQELPYGIVPEVYVPWRPPGQGEHPHSSGGRPSQERRSAAGGERPGTHPSSGSLP